MTPVQLHQQFADLLGGILQIRIQGHHEAPRGLLESGQDSRVLTCVGPQADHTGLIRARLVLFAQQGHGAVTAAIVHENHLIAAT